MAVPSAFEQENLVLGAPPGVPASDIETISVCRMLDPVTATPVMVSCWKITKSELDEITRTGRIWLSVQGCLAPPIGLSGLCPIPPDTTNDGPSDPDDKPVVNTERSEHLLRLSKRLTVEAKSLEAMSVDERYTSEWKALYKSLADDLCKASKTAAEFRINRT